ncbi:MAG: zf-HC2 domain-containing protein [Pirellulales bacterium]|nr:zf-HC2 domain-containing protein [Pirellulales bacterium]
MNDKFANDELLSAYVDGELAGEELAQVEERLRTDPAARQMVTELQELSATLHALPRETVGHDLRTSILQCDKKALERGTSVPRRWMWAAAALAAALMLTLYLPDSQQREEAHLADKSKIAERKQSKAPPRKALADASEVAEMEVATAEGVTGEMQKASQGATAKAKESSTEYGVHVTYTDPEKFKKLLSDQGLSFSDVSGKKKLEAQLALGEQVLVEAPPQQIERLLAACHADTLACQSLRITGKALDIKQLQSWQRWQRNGLAASQPTRIKAASERENPRGIGRANAPESNKAEEAKSGLQSDLAPALSRSEVQQEAQPVRVLFILQEAPAP